MAAKLNLFVKRFKQVLLFGGLFNVIFAAPLAFPIISNYYLIFLNKINSAFHLGGQLYTISSNPLHSFFINTAGLDLVFIGAIVLYAAINPIERKSLVLLNAIGRIFFAGLVVYYVIMKNIAHITIFFGIIDFTLSIIFLYFLYRLKNNEQVIQSKD
jgi:hypothetical protein